MSTQLAPARDERYSALSALILKTHRLHGGSTYTLNGHNMIGTHGYAVSIFPELEQTLANDHLTAAMIRRYITRNYSALKKPTSAIGTWADNGLAYLDTVVIVKSKRDAIALGSKAHQLAIFDLHSLQTIPITDYHNVTSNKLVA